MTGRRSVERFGLGGLLIPALILMAMMNMRNEAMAQTADEAGQPLSYTMTVTGENLFAIIDVNGARIYFHNNMRPLLITLPVAATLQPGLNKVVIDYEPLDPSTETYTPHDGVMLQVKLERRTYEGAPTPFEEGVHLFSGKYDKQTGQMIAASDQSVFQQGALIHEDGGLRAGPVAVESTEIVYGNAVSEGHAMRVTMEVMIDDPWLNAPPWADGPALADTPELRAKLAQRYRQLHGIVASEDETAWRQEMRLVYGHLSRVLGYVDADAMADHVRSLTPLGAPPGASVAPLPSALEGNQLQFGVDNRMVRFIPNPVSFETPEGERVGGYGFFFCRIGDRLEICFMQDIPN